MANVSLTQAAKLAGVSRATLYRKYINTGEITVTTSRDGKKQIDTSEIIRVFGEIKGTEELTPTQPTDQIRQPETRQDTVSGTKKRQLETPSDNQALHSEIALLKERLKASEKETESLRQDKQWLQSQVEGLTEGIKLLEGPKHPPLWWQFWK
ncbi:MAG: hypothetical protein ACPG51_18950 [Thiolinea sp.]